jgi:hypothetical protein
MSYLTSGCTKAWLGHSLGFLALRVANARLELLCGEAPVERTNVSAHSQEAPETSHSHTGYSEAIVSHPALGSPGDTLTDEKP